jgi:DNA-directed RNA polymerase specialized sigma24 family protein
MLYELDDLFSKLSDKDKFRVICHYILKLPSKQIAELENCQRTTIEMTFIRTEKKLKNIRTHDDLIAALQIIFEK